MVLNKKRGQQPEPQEAIKRLMILGLLQQGVMSKDIAEVLGVDPSIITRMVPAKRMRNLRERR